MAEVTMLGIPGFPVNQRAILESLRGKCRSIPDIAHDNLIETMDIRRAMDSLKSKGLVFKTPHTDQRYNKKGIKSFKWSLTSTGKYIALNKGREVLNG